MLFQKLFENIYKSQMFVRCDDTGLAHYFSHLDFPGLEARPYSFTAGRGHTLNGNFYCYPGNENGPLVVFDHGFGGGHRSYMVEIERLCAHGCLVFAYDHTGCMTSGGDNAGGFGQSLHDLDDCIRALKADAAVDARDISVMGHSWGGFSTLNIAALHPEVRRVVVLAGFVSVPKMIEQFTPGLLRIYRPCLFALEKAANPEHVEFDAVRSLAQADVQALLLYSQNDHLVSSDIHYAALAAGLKGKKNITLHLQENKGHSPAYTLDAVQYLAQYSAAAKKAAKKLKTDEEKAAFRNSYDWRRMTAQDDAVWARIFAHLDARDRTL